MRTPLGAKWRGYRGRAFGGKRRRERADVIKHRERTAGYRQHVLGPDHPSTLDSYDGLAQAYLAAGRYSEAVSLFEFNLAAWQRTGGSDEKISIAEANLGFAYFRIGRLDDAIRHLENAAAKQRLTFGPDQTPSEDFLRIRVNLALVYLRAGRVDDAIRLLEEDAADQQPVLGRNERTMLVSRGLLSRAYERVGRLAEACEQAESAYTDALRYWPADLLTLRVGILLAELYRTNGLLEKAIPLCERNLAQSLKLKGRDRLTLLTRNNLGACYRDASRLDEAIPLFERNLADAPNVLPASSPLLAKIREKVPPDYGLGLPSVPV